MKYVVYQCKHCGYIDSEPLTCSSCGSRLQYYEGEGWCPKCKNYRERRLMFSCGGCNKYHPYVRNLPYD